MRARGAGGLLFKWIVCVICVSSRQKTNRSEFISSYFSVSLSTFAHFHCIYISSSFVISFLPFFLHLVFSLKLREKFCWTKNLWISKLEVLFLTFIEIYFGFWGWRRREFGMSSKFGQSAACDAKRVLPDFYFIRFIKQLCTGTRVECINS